MFVPFWFWNQPLLWYSETTYPCGNATTTVSKGDGCLFHPRRSEAVEEVGLASYLAVLKVRIAKLADIDLQDVSLELLNWQT